MAEYYFWCIHDIGGHQPYLFGPYKSKEAAENRMRKCRGGEASVLKTFERNPQEALDEYRSKAVA